MPALPVNTIKYITFFGDSSVSEDSDVYREVFEIAKLLAGKGYGIVNGGGPGVMKAATDGAESVEGDTVAVYWEPRLASIFEGKNLSNITDHSEAYSNYMQRTLGLIEKGQVYIVFQGGTGTLSELGMVWALAKLYYGKHKPVILYGAFWKELISAIDKALLIDDNELAVLNYAETPEEVLELVDGFELEIKRRARRKYSGDELPFVISTDATPLTEKQLAEKMIKKRYRVVKEITKREITRFREQVQAPARVLMVGCAGSYDLSQLADNYAVTALELNEDVFEVAQLENPEVDVLLMDVRDYEVQENVFKGVWARSSMHYLHDEDQKAVFAKLARGLVQGGVMQIIVRAGEGEKYEEEVIGGKTVRNFVNPMTESQLRELAEQNNLEVLDLEEQRLSHKWLAVLLRKR